LAAEASSSLPRAKVDAKQGDTVELLEHLDAVAVVRSSCLPS
jgi:hypothetical protein